MALRINFDTAGNPELSTFILAHKDGRIIGELSNISDVKIRGSLKEPHEISLTFHKENEGVVSEYWEDMIDFRLVFCKEWNTWFEAIVSKDQDDETVKNVSLTQLGQAELSQIRIYDTEINTENDIARDDYVNPTVLYKPSNPDESLTHRLMKDKAPHYSIRHVDNSLKNIQRTFMFNDKALTECFEEIADELDALIVYDSDSDDVENGNITVNRTISIYDMLTSCNACGHRGEFEKKCPECGSTNITEGYGTDTTICVSGECLGNNITIDVDTDAVKNCYRLSAGDDLMTATIKSCNPNGSSYIWHVSNQEKIDMTDELIKKLESYFFDYNFYQKEYSPTLTSDIVSKYNSLVSKYSIYHKDLSAVGNIVGYPMIMEMLWNAIDFKLFLQYNLMPMLENSGTSASKQAALLTAATLSPVAVSNIDALSVSTANSAVLGFAKILLDKRYQVKIKQSSLSGITWTGVFTVTNYSYPDDTADSAEVSVVISDDYETYINQRLVKKLESNTYSGSISDLFSLSTSAFKQELAKYGLSSLTTFNDACQGCIEILIEQGIHNNETWANTTPNMYEEVYVPYIEKQKAIQDEIFVRESELNDIIDLYNQLIIVRDGIQKALNFENYLGTQLWHDFSAYRREETYSNDNYISDGLSNAELFKNAYEFIQKAEASIEKASSYRHQISTTMKNLLVIDDFKPLKEHFEIGNWIRVKDDDEKIYKLRLLDYEIDFEDLSEISVTFSDAIKIVDKTTEIKDTIVKTSSIINNYNATIQNTLNKYETLSDKVDSSQTNNNVNNNEIGNKVDKDGVIGSINSSNGTISLSRLDYNALFAKMFTVSNVDIEVDSALDTNHIYIYYLDNGSGGGSGDSGDGGDSGSDSGTIGDLATGYLYSYGVTSNIVGGWNLEQPVTEVVNIDTTVGFTDDCISITKTESTAQAAIKCYGVNPIDIAGYNTLNIKYSYVANTDTTFMIGLGNGNNSTDWTSGWSNLQCVRTSDTTETDSSLSISLDSISYTGDLYLYLYYITDSASAHGCEIKIKEIWLESVSSDDSNEDGAFYAYNEGVIADEIGVFVSELDGSSAHTIYEMNDCMYILKDDISAGTATFYASNPISLTGTVVMHVLYSYIDTTGGSGSLLVGLQESASVLSNGNVINLEPTSTSEETFVEASKELFDGVTNIYPYVMARYYVDSGISGTAEIKIKKIWFTGATVSEGTDPGSSDSGGTGDNTGNESGGTTEDTTTKTYLYNNGIVSDEIGTWVLSNGTANSSTGTSSATFSEESDHLYLTIPNDGTNGTLAIRSSNVVTGHNAYSKIGILFDYEGEDLTTSSNVKFKLGYANEAMDSMAATSLSPSSSEASATLYSTINKTYVESTYPYFYIGITNFALATATTVLKIREIWLE